MKVPPTVDGLNKKLTTFGELAENIARIIAKYRQPLIAIDGGGGAGKTTFSNALQKAMPSSHIVRIDDFYRPEQLRVPLESTKSINPNFDWNRLQASIFDAVRENKAISYQRYDHSTGVLSNEVIQVPDSVPIIIEGVWSMQEAFLDFYHYRIWLEAPADIRLERGVKRDGEDFRETWELEWIPIDDYYRQTYKPYLKADCVINSADSDFLADKIILK